MKNYSYTALILASAATAAVAEYTCVSPVNRGDGVVDLFGTTPYGDIWHKFSRVDGLWEPERGFEVIAGAVSDCPAASSWGSDHISLVYVVRNGSNVMHQYYNDEWSSGAEDLGGGMTSVNSIALAPGQLEIVGLSEDGSYVGKSWNKHKWHPKGTKWDNMGGNFISKPALTSWGRGRLDVIGIDAETGSLRHKYYQRKRWSKWEDLGGGPFIGNPVATSWGPNRMDFWAIDSEGELNHLFWDGTQYQGWENLGGRFTDTPKVVHYDVDKIDIVGKNIDDGKYNLKTWDGHQWSPKPTEYYTLAGPFSSEPGFVAKHGENFLYIFGVDEQDVLRLQVWTGSEWLPKYDTTWELGTLPKGTPDGGPDDKNHKDQSVLGSEL